MTTNSKHIVAILGQDNNDIRALRRIIEEGPYLTRMYHTPEALESGLKEESCLAAILDVDNVHLENRTIRRLTRSFPAVFFFCTSRDRFHPELKNAISCHLFACLNKPVDPEELHYFLRCVRNEARDSRGPPKT